MKSEESLISASTKYRYSENKLESQIPQFAAFKEQYKEKILEVKKIYPHGVIGKNDSGKVIVMDKIGTLKLGEIAKYFDDDALIAYTFQRLLHLSENVLKEKEQVIWIIDLSGKIMQLASKKTYAIAEKIILGAQKYFAGMLYKLYFVNTPMLFDAIWSKISEGLDDHTLNKIIHLSDDIEEILTEVDLCILPKCLGGAQSDNVLMQKEANLQKNKEIGEEEQEEENEIEEVDFTSLKMALGNLKLGSSHNQSVSNTPLNTEADDRSA